MHKWMSGYMNCGGSARAWCFVFGLFVCMCVVWGLCVRVHVCGGGVCLCVCVRGDRSKTLGQTRKVCGHVNFWTISLGWGKKILEQHEKFSTTGLRQRKNFGDNSTNVEEGQKFRANNSDTG